MGWSEADIPALNGKYALITGGASGIGFAAAQALAEHSLELIIADRNAAAAEAAIARIRERSPRAQITFRELDLADMASVRAFAGVLLEEARPIDLLINNAGIQPLSERRTSRDGFELTFGIGHVGHFLLTALLYPLIRQASAARIVTVSSMVHAAGRFDWSDIQMERGYSAQRAYNQTKLANLLFARELQRRIDCKGDDVLSLAVHPGVARTSIGSNRRSLGQFGLGDHVVSLVLSLVKIGRAHV